MSDGVVFAYASRDIQIGPATQQPQPGTFAITNAAATALNTSRALDTANAPAGQTVTWAITGRTHANDTTINTATGAITAGRVPGTVTIRATAGTGATAVQSAPVTITIGTPAQRPSEWALVDVAPAIHANLVPARLQTNQHYTRHITRAEFAELAVILFEAQRGPITGFNPLPFEDTTNQFVARAAHIDVVRGVSATRFEPDSLISREQAAAMLSRLAAALGRPIPNHTSTFADNAQISDWASAYVGQKQGSGVMVGVAGNRFDPHSRFTVEQSITTIMRIRDL
ncbi:MAG: hypothetical protein FWC72_04765 [Oscillospiraceae bacterium]|nr:hypothetical protein [Oscillospiraceae bacterium]